MPLADHHDGSSSSTSESTAVSLTPSGGVLCAVWMAPPTLFGETGLREDQGPIVEPEGLGARKATPITAYSYSPHINGYARNDIERRASYRDPTSPLVHEIFICRHRDRRSECRRCTPLQTQSYIHQRPSAGLDPQIFRPGGYTVRVLHVSPPVLSIRATYRARVFELAFIGDLLDGVHVADAEETNPDQRALAKLSLYSVD